MAVMRKCVCCGKEYKYCPNCARKNSQPLWKMTFCSETCQELFNIVSAYNSGRVGKAELQSFIAEHDMDTNYKEPIQKVLNEIRNG